MLYFVIRYHAKIEMCEKSFKTALVPSSVENITLPNQNPETVFLNFQRFLETDSASLCSLPGRYDNPIPTRFLAPIDCCKIPAQVGESKFRMEERIRIPFCLVSRMGKRQLAELGQ
jgi:hypothetical protein